ncbi:MAG: hypothetical protein ABIF19_04915 [Planctomycetota bacterium]
MTEERIEQLLHELGRRTVEPVRPGLAEEIKQHIPPKLHRHRIGWETVSIIIDLRLSRSAAAAAIVVTMILLLNLFADRDQAGGGILRDSVLVIKYWGGAGKTDTSVIRSKYEHLLERGADVTWYGDRIDPKDRGAILMQQKLSDGRYLITLTDGSERETDSDGLIRLLGRMLQK